ncbi:uncharacterized protein LOC124315307 isoform X1 [Daphnia pulicaria]|uniref:uncharacterized protein LOC124315307 isoform X1 n=1 Tax=Daphnia pulicaria TaxID=35523 RepID=UPI001EEB9780|nr:uncharacterized protein LOC124315307 isoform X1 [Daphnia pulicaria]
MSSEKHFVDTVTLYISLFPPPPYQMSGTVRTGWTDIFFLSNAVCRADSLYRPATCPSAVCFHLSPSCLLVQVVPFLRGRSRLPEMLKIETSLWPLIVWMRIVGFHMGPSRKKSGSPNRHRYSVCLLMTGSLMLLSTVALHCTSFVRSFLKFRSNGMAQHNGTTANLTTANRLNVGIEHLNYTCVLIGVHTTFFFVSLTSNWTGLWDSLQLIEANLKFNSTFYRKCQKCVVIGFAILFVDFASQLFISIHSFYWDMGWMSPLAIVLANISRTTIISVFLLFFVLARVITLVFQGLNEQIVHLDEVEQVPQCYSVSRILNIRLEKWRRNHTLACELVEMVNKSFGFVMLITLVNVFVSFVTTSFEIVRSMEDDETLPFLLVFIFVKKLILLTIMFYEPYRLQAETGRTASSLRRLHPFTADLFTQIKVNTVVMEVSHACPKITAIEFFDVNLKLLPTLIGSTLTYVAILHQVASHSK